MIYKIVYTKDFKEGLQDIYNYIANVLKEKQIANQLIIKIFTRILNLKIFPRLYMKIGKMDRLHNFIYSRWIESKSYYFSYIL